MAADNPFVYGEIVPAAAFVGRDVELERLTTDLASGQKVFLISPRRYGKSSLVRQAAAALGAAAHRDARVHGQQLQLVRGVSRGLRARARRPRDAERRRRGPGSASLFTTVTPEIRVEAGAGGGVITRLSVDPHRSVTPPGSPKRCSRCPRASPRGWAAASSSRSTSSRPSDRSTAAASNRRCAPPFSSSARSAMCSRARSRA